MTERFAVVTPTGDRHQLFDICKKWVFRQSILPAQWLVVDDGTEPLDGATTAGLDYVRRVPQAGEPRHTLVLNMLEALQHIKYEKVVVIEDDDWYHPRYFETMLELLNHWDLTGLGRSIYYHFPNRLYRKLNNRRNASLCQTAFRSDVIPTLRAICQSTRSYTIDLMLWRQYKSLKKVLLNKPTLCVGMKGLPGRRGLASGHRTKSRGYREDPNYEFLERIIGNDLQIYVDLVRSSS